MTRRLIAACIVAAATGPVTAATTDTAPEPIRSGQVLRTTDGVPDLQGLWTSATITGLERPAQFDSLVIDEAEAAAWEAANTAVFEAIDEIPEGGLEVGGDVGGYLHRPIAGCRRLGLPIFCDVPQRRWRMIPQY